MTEMLKQGRFDARTVTEQVIVAFAMNEGAADDVPVEKISRFELEIIEKVKTNYPEFESIVMSGRKLTCEQLDRLRKVIRS